MNPRNLGRVLELIGGACSQLATLRGEDIPPIRCLVVSKKSLLPSKRMEVIMPDYEKRSEQEQRECFKREVERMRSFRRWEDVLRDLGIKRT